MLLLDTDVLIDIQKGRPQALAWFGSLTELPYVPGLVVMELIQGAQNTQQVRQALKLVAPMPVVWPTETDCARALSDFSVFRLTHGLGLLDSLIAACALGRSATLCTFNSKHYRAVPGLSILEPYVKP